MIQDPPRRADAAPAGCFHCGLPAATPLASEVGGGSRTFCCRGCLAVAEAIVGAVGIGYYERRAEAPGAPPPRPEPLDRDAAGWVVAEGDRREATFAVDGLHCGSCVWLIERTIGRLPGVLALRVLLGPRRVRVIWHARRLELDTLIGEFCRLGFRAVPVDPARAGTPAAGSGWLRAGIAAVGAGLAMWLEDPLQVGSFAAHEQGLEAYLRGADAILAGGAGIYAMWPFVLGALRGLRARVPGMDLTIALGALALLATAATRAATGAGAPGFMMLDLYLALLLAGRSAEESVRARVLGEAGRLLRAAPARVRVQRDGREELVSPGDVFAGETVEIRAGERIPVDGTVVSGCSDVRDAVLTGEPGPRARGPGDAVLAGSHALDGRLVVRAARPGRGMPAELAQLADEAAAQRTPLRQLTDRAGAWGAVAMVVLAGSAAWIGGPNAATAALLVFCPCALGLAVPAALAAAGATGVKEGFLIADGAAFERLPAVDCVVLDKTGTVTAGDLALVDVSRPAGSRRSRDQDLGASPGSACILPTATWDREALRMAAALAAGSDHPVSRAVRQAAERLGDVAPARDIRVEPGSGVAGNVGGRPRRLGRPAWAAPDSPVPDLPEPGLTLVALGCEGEALAWLVLADRPDPAAPAVLGELRAAGIRLVLVSGDREAVARDVGDRLGIAEVAAEVGPREKLALVRRLASEGASVAMIGDGINDAPALAAARVGVAMGRGVDVARDVAGLVLLGGLQAFPRARRAAIRTRSIVRQNLWIAAAYNLVAVPAALAGFVSPPVAALLMPLSSLLVLGNAFRLVRGR